MNCVKNCPLLFVMLVICEGCLSYKWSATAQLDNLSQESKEALTQRLQEDCSTNNGEFDPVTGSCKGVLILTQASGDDRIGCYLSFWIYGGWCWFIGPDEVDKELALTIAKKRLNAPVTVEYLGRR